MNMKRLVVLAPLLLLLMAQAPAPVAPPPAALDPSESAVVQELEVVGRPPGPAMWTVRRGQGTVILMGGLSPLPHSLEWETRRLERNMEGADLVLLPPTGRIGLFDGAYMLFHAGDLRLGGGHRLHEVLSPEERRRFDALLAQAKGDPRRYESLKPAIAALALDGDYLKAMGFSTAKPGSTVKRLADAHHIRTKAEGGIPVVDLFRSVVRMDDAAEHACFNEIIGEVERTASRGHPLAEAWAAGDLRTVRAEYKPDSTERCVAGTPGLQGLVEKLTRDATASMDAALNHGGKTVAVVDLTLLLRSNGVLDRLKAAGADITVPMD